MIWTLFLVWRIEQEFKYNKIALAYLLYKKCKNSGHEFESVGYQRVIIDFYRWNGLL